MDGLSNHEKDSRPWGSWERFTANESTTVKILTLTPNQSLSLQTHTGRDEFWRILSGSGHVQIDETTMDAKPGDSFYAKRGAKHRMESGADGLIVLEIAFGHYDEDDITRLEDRYGRV